MKMTGINRHLKNLAAYKAACDMINLYEDLRTEYGSHGMRLHFAPFWNPLVIAPACYHIKRWYFAETILKKLEKKLESGHAYDHWPWDTELDQLIARIAKESWNDAYHLLRSIHHNGRPYYVILDEDFIEIKVIDLALNQVMICHPEKETLRREATQEEIFPDKNIEMEYDECGEGYQIQYNPFPDEMFSFCGDTIEIPPNHCKVLRYKDITDNVFDIEVAVVHKSQLFDEIGNLIIPQSFVVESTHVNPGYKDPRKKI